MTPTFSIVVPVYQNEKNLPKTIPELLKLGTQLTDFDFELVLIDDGSSDDSYRLMCDFAQQHPEHITTVKLTRNFGQTAAVQAGLTRAKGDCIGIISADLQEPPEKFLEMLELWREGHKFIVGHRAGRPENALQRGISNAFWRLVQRYALKGYPKTGFDFCVIDREIVEQVNATYEKNSSIFMLIFWLGYDARFVQIHRRQRELGTSQWSLAKKLATAMDALIGFTYVPSRVITALGLSSAALSLLYLTYLIIRWEQSGNAPVGWMTSVGLQLLIGSLILFSLGIISEYLVRILDETRGRPPFVIDEEQSGTQRLGETAGGTNAEPATAKDSPTVSQSEVAPADSSTSGQD